MKEDREVKLSFILGVGESATLDCSSAGAPSPNISWSFPPNSQLGQGPPPTSLILDVQLADGVDAGEYGCVVQNEAGSITRTFTVKLASEWFSLKSEDLNLRIDKVFIWL